MLNLIQLDLDGWLSYAKESIDLTKGGITRIQGSTGAGKSAILEAVVYLLFGNTLRDKSSVADLSNKVLNKGYDISLEFEIYGVNYKINETRDRGLDDLYFFIDGEDSRGKTKQETRKKILDVLNMTMEEFVGISVLGQRATQTLIEGKSAERAKLVTAIFGLEKYDQYIKDVQVDLKDTKRNKDELAERIEDYKKDLENLKESLVVESLDEVSDEDIQKIQQKIEKFDKKLEKIRKKERDILQGIEKHKEIERKKEKLKKVEKQISEIESKLEDFDDKIKKMKPDTLTDKLYILRDQRSAYYGEIKRAKDDLKRLKETKECPITNESCPVNVPEKHFSKVKERADAVIKENEKNIEKVSKRIEKGTKIVKEVNEFCALSRDLESKRNTLEFSKDSFDEDLPDLDELYEVKKKCDDAKSVGAEKIRDLVKQKEQLLGKQAASIERARYIESVENTLKEKAKILKKFEKELNETSEEVLYLSGTLNIFKRAKMYKIDLVLELLNENLEELLKKISVGYSAKITSEKMDSRKKRSLDKLDILVYNGSVWLPIGLTSGGQSGVVGLAVLLSIWKTANGLSHKGVSTLWLDEVFGPVSEDMVNEIFSAIIDLSMDLGAVAIKLVSHRKLDTRYIDYTWNVERTDGVSKLSCGR